MFGSMALTARTKSVGGMGEALDGLNHEALEEDALRSPGENLERGLRLIDDALRMATELGAIPEDKHKVPLIVLWRALKRHRG